jgi:ribosomal protein S18 acetylase RimI-like enzyme
MWPYLDSAPVQETVLLERNLRGLAALYRLLGHYAGDVLELSGATGAIVDTAPRYPWLNALVCTRPPRFAEVLARVIERAELEQLAIWSCGAEQAEIASDAGFTSLVASVPAMSMELDGFEERDRAGEPIAPAEAGAVSDAAYGNIARELERTLARIPTERMRACGRRDTAGRVIAAAVSLDSEADCSLQYVATRPDAQRLGHGLALLADALTQARVRGCTTTSLQSSDAGVPLYRRLGYRTVGQLELRRRPARGWAAR